MSSGEAIIEIDSLSKSYGQTTALDSASARVLSGEVLALAGENGSGKSTLVKVLSGIQVPDSGTVTIDGNPLAYGNPRASLAARVVTVFQEVLSVEPMTVLDNVWLGSDGVFAPHSSRAQRRELATAVLADLLGEAPALDMPVEELTLSDRQACSIARALLREPHVIILDEATSALDLDTRERLFGIVRRLTSQGGAAVIISHRMDEIEEIADRIVVMRSGKTVAEFTREGWTASELIVEMSGVDHRARVEVRDRPSASTQPILLTAEHIQLAPDSRPFDALFRAGEITGLAGLEGQGQDRFLRSLWGDHVVDGRIERVSGAERQRITSRKTATRNRIVYVPRERRDESIFGALSILDNFALPTIRRDTTFGIVRRNASRSRFRPFIADLRIKYGRDVDAMSTLSGGNQQKIVVARWLAANPDVILLNDPTRGIDINAKRDLYELLGTIASQGMSVIMLSSEIDEHLELMDHVIVFKDQSVHQTFSHEDITRESLVAAYFGQEASPA